MSKPQNTKLCDQLTYNDYLEHPIWGFLDDDGDEVMPVEYPGHLIWSEGGEALWVLGKLILQDKTELPGIIGVRMTDQSIYLLKFIKKDFSLYYFPVNSSLENRNYLIELTAIINKSENQIFPVTYVTKYKFENGKHLSGTYQIK